MSEPAIKNMDGFKPACPKCGSISGFGITRLNNVSYEKKGSWDDRIFACMCGKRLYGKAIFAEFQRQEQEYKENRIARASEEEKHRKEAERQRRREAREAKKRAEEEARLAEERAEKELLLAKDTGDCGWKDCDNRARENSLYCSRACSNKNARWRHKQRKKGGKK